MVHAMQSPRISSWILEQKNLRAHLQQVWAAPQTNPTAMSRPMPDNFSMSALDNTQPVHVKNKSVSHATLLEPSTIYFAENPTENRDSGGLPKVRNEKGEKREEIRGETRKSQLHFF